MSNPIHISPRFCAEIELHLVRNLIRLPAPGTPLLLGIHGPAGVGKSFQLDTVLRQVGVAVLPISSADLESDRANDPARLVRKTYLDAAQKMEADGVVAAAVVINDIDAALGDWGAMVQYTVNRQLVIGELMHLCDRPSSVTGRPNQRVPIFLTGNDFTKLYGPLRRSGRMKLFHWRPDAGEMVEILRAVLPQLPIADIAELVEQFPDKSTSFFVDALNDARDQYVRSLLQDYGVREVVWHAKQGQIATDDHVGIADLIAAAKCLLANEQAVANYASAASEER